MPLRLLPIRLLILGLVLFLCPAVPARELPTTPPEAVGISRDRLKRLDDLMEQYVREGKIAGAVTYIARHGKVAHLKAYGQRDREQQAPMKTDALFRIASMTKALTSVGAMILVEEGAVRLNDPVSRFIPAFAKTTVISKTPDGKVERVPAKRPITIRDLLTHTAGISYGANPAEEEYKKANLHMWYFADKQESLAESIDRLPSLPFDSQPGEKFVYGFNTDILGRVIEVASGQRLDEFFHKRILQPLEMNDTHFFLPKEKATRLTAVYAATGNGLKRSEGKGREGQGDYVEGPRKNFSGGAGLVASTTDYGRFLQMLLDGGKLGGVRILSPASVAAMTSNQVGDLYENGNLGFGLGFYVVEDIGKAGRLASEGEFGWGGAYFTQYWVAPKEGIVALMMTQLLPSGGLDLQDKFRALVYQAVAEAPSLVPATRFSHSR